MNEFVSGETNKSKYQLLDYSSEGFFKKRNVDESFFRKVLHMLLKVKVFM